MGGTGGSKIWMPRLNATSARAKLSRPRGSTQTPLMEAEMPTVRDGGVATTPRDAEMEHVRQPTSEEEEQSDVPVASSKEAPTEKEADSSVTAALMVIPVMRKKLRLRTAERSAWSERPQVADAENEDKDGMRKRKERPSLQSSGRRVGKST